MENLELVLPEIFISLSIMFLLILGVFKKHSSRLIQNISLLVLLITAVKVMDEYHETKKKVEQKKVELKELSNKFKELKSLVYEYKDRKEEEIENLSKNQVELKDEIEQNQKHYEKLIDAAADEISNFVEKANINKIS